jgi:pimeloyl-ACP methyl ester carboxylesterase
MPTLTPTGRARTPDEVGIAYYDLGGHGPVVLLVHATGFCAALLAPLADRLGGRYHCIAIDERAHGLSDRPPGDDFRWYGFAADVLAVVDHLGLDRPSAFGHSCGGAALLVAEEARPGTFAALYCYEPIVYPGDTPLAPNLEANPLSTGALRRRQVFGSRQEALDNFSTKAPFDRLHPEVLAAYVDNGFGPVPGSGPGSSGGIGLRCRREDEAQVYAHSLAHDAFAHLDQVRCPVTLACGAETDAIGPTFLERFAERLPRCRIEIFPGLGHFGPLEDPDAVARSLPAALAGPAGSSGDPGGPSADPGGTRVDLGDTASA